MTKKVLVPIADGTEEIEAVCIIDVLRRAGAEVTIAGRRDARQEADEIGARYLELDARDPAAFERALRLALIQPPPGPGDSSSRRAAY